MDFATEDFSNLLLAVTACQKQELHVCFTCAVFTQTPPKKEKKKENYSQGQTDFW